MESGSYKEFHAKTGGAPKFTAILITVVTVILCLLIGIGSWILVTGNTDNAVPVGVKESTIEKIIIVEEPIVENKESELERSILSEVQDVLRNEEESLPKTNDMAQAFFVNDDDTPKSRQRRSIVSDIGMNALAYVNYLSFGRFMFNEVYSITEYAVEGRKLSGDADAFLLDAGFGYGNAVEDSEEETEIEKSDSTALKPTKSNRPASAYDDGWTPMVNKVSLKFVTDMLTTLLNLMKEYLMKDHVMECLWYMFCKDMNHQAKYNDPMGYLARVNRSVYLTIILFSIM